MTYSDIIKKKDVKSIARQTRRKESKMRLDTTGKYKVLYVNEMEYMGGKLPDYEILNIEGNITLSEGKHSFNVVSGTVTVSPSAGKTVEASGQATSVVLKNALAENFSASGGDQAVYFDVIARHQ